MKASLLATVCALALVVPTAGAVLRTHAVNPAPVPADNGTPACADARGTAQKVDGYVARFRKSLVDSKTRVRQAEAALAVAKAKLRAKPDDATLRLGEATAAREVSEARSDVVRVQKEGKRLQDLIDQLAATASAQCKQAEPTPAETTDELAVPADTGTKECGDDRNQMMSLLRSVEHLGANEAFREAGPLGLSDVARRQIETRIKRLMQQLKGIAPKAVKACVIDFTGGWTGTYHEAADSCAPSGATGRTTMTLTQTGDSLSGTLTDQGYELGCSTVDVHGSITGTVTKNTASIQIAYDNDAGTFRGTLTLTGDTISFQEDSGDSATFTRG